MSYVVLLGVVGALMLIESVRVLRAARRQDGGQPAPGRRAHLARRPAAQDALSPFAHLRQPDSLRGVGAFIGLLTAIMGVGGGFMLVPAMIYLMRIPTRIVIGTSTVQILCVTAFTTVLQATMNHTVDLLLSVPLMAGSVVGAQFGVGFSERFKAEQLRALLALIVVAVAVRMAFGLVIRPWRPVQPRGADVAWRVPGAALGTHGAHVLLSRVRGTGRVRLAASSRR